MSKTSNGYSWKIIINQSVEFFNKILEKDRICLLYHGDADGAVSAVYIDNILRKLRGRGADYKIFVPSFSYDLNAEAEMVLNTKPDKLIVLDLSIDSKKDILASFSESIDSIFIYDHHYYQSVPDAGNITYFNPRLISEKDMWHPASFFGYEMYNEFAEKGESIRHWLCGIGLTGDFAFNSFPAVAECIQAANPELLVKDPDTKQNKLAQMAIKINSGFLYDPMKRNDISFRCLDSAFVKDDPALLFDTNTEPFGKLIKTYDSFREEVRNTVEEIEKQGALDKDLPLVFHNHTSAHYVTALASESYIVKNHDKVIILGFAQDFFPNISIEIRVGDNISLNLPVVLNKQREFINFLSAGGHPQAGGAVILPEDYEKFKSTFVELSKQHIKLNVNASAK